MPAASLAAVYMVAVDSEALVMHKAVRDTAAAGTEVLVAYAAAEIVDSMLAIVGHMVELAAADMEPTAGVVDNTLVVVEHMAGPTAESMEVLVAGNMLAVAHWT